jgi:hypothetical protein
MMQRKPRKWKEKALVMEKGCRTALDPPEKIRKVYMYISLSFGYMTRLAFERKELNKDRFFHKLFRVPNRLNVAVEINNLLSEKNIKDIGPEDLMRIYEKYKIKSSKKIIKHLKNLYESYLEFCLKDKKLSKDELHSLKLLKDLFDLSDKDVKEIEEDVVKKVYGETLNEFLKDDKISKSEKEILKELEKNLTIKQSVLQEIYNKKVSNIYQNYLDKTISDERLSPDEEKQLKVLADNLNIKKINMAEQTKHLLDKYKLFWKIDNGDIPNVDVQISLQKNETCHFKTNINLFELRRITRRINYGGPTLRLKIMKGVYYRAGSLGIQIVSQDVMTHVDSGNLFLTNKRIIFIGSKKNTTIRLNKVLDFECFKNGVSISKETGKSPFYEFNEDTDLFCVILGVLLKNI